MLNTVFETQYCNEISAVSRRFHEGGTKCYTTQSTMTQHFSMTSQRCRPPTSTTPTTTHRVDDEAANASARVASVCAQLVVNSMLPPHIVFIVLVSIATSTLSATTSANPVSQNATSTSPAANWFDQFALRPTSSDNESTVTQDFDYDGRRHSINCSSPLNNAFCGNLTDDGNMTSSSVVLSTGREQTRGWLMTEIQLIKAIVLVIVVCILLLSTCTFLFRTSSLFAKSREDDPGWRHRLNDVDEQDIFLLPSSTERKTVAFERNPDVVGYYWQQLVTLWQHTKFVHDLYILFTETAETGEKRKTTTSQIKQQ